MKPKTEHMFVINVLARVEDYAVDGRPIKISIEDMNKTGYLIVAGHNCSPKKPLILAMITVNVVNKVFNASVLLNCDGVDTEYSFEATKENSLKLFDLLTQIKWAYYTPCAGSSTKPNNPTRKPTR